MSRGGLSWAHHFERLHSDGPHQGPRVTDWPQPVKVKDVQSFIGFMNFYWRFICNFSKIACPLHALTHKSEDWSWGAAKQQAFDALKGTLASAPTLAFPSKFGPF